MRDDPDQSNQAARRASRWKACIAAWNDLVLGFGHPMDLVRWGWMRALEHRALGYWLRSLEDLVRDAIFRDALTRDVPTSILRRRKRADRRYIPPASPDDMPRFRPTCRFDPTSWKVSFRMSKPGQGGHRRSPRRSREPAARRLCRGFAYRIEALRRAINYREDYVVRYARRLARQAEAARANDPILLPLPDDPPASQPERRVEEQPIQISPAIPQSPPINMLATRGIAPPNAKHIEPG